MPRLMPKKARAHLNKARAAARSAVEVYNRPGSDFRTPHFIVLMAMAWTALFHAVFYKRKIKPWYSTGHGPGKRYTRIDGEPKHWELSECLRQYFGDRDPPERANLRYLIGLRNKIEHRDLPELDPYLYGECQAALLNFERLLVEVFGEQFSLAETLALSLQFSRATPETRRKALQTLASSAAEGVRDYIETFRAELPRETLESPQYMFNVYLVPKLANRESAADLAVEFVHYDPENEEQAKEVAKAIALIKERHVPVASANLLRFSDVVDELARRLPYRANQHTVVRAWQHFDVRPPTDAEEPETTDPRYCVYDKPHGDYLYKMAWVDFLVEKLSDPGTYEDVTGVPAVEEGG